MYMVDSSVLNDVQNERHAQDKKWGEQNHRDTDPTARHEYVATFCAAHAKQFCDAAAREHRLTWFHIHIEELWEAIEECGHDEMTEAS